MQSYNADTYTVLAKVSANFDLANLEDNRPTAEDLVAATQEIITENHDSKLSDMLSKLSFAPFDSFESRQNPNIVTITSRFDFSTHGSYTGWKKAIEFVLDKLLLKFNIQSATFFLEDKPVVIRQGRRY